MSTGNLPERSSLLGGWTPRPVPAVRPRPRWLGVGLVLLAGCASVTVPQTDFGSTAPESPERDSPQPPIVCDRPLASLRPDGPATSDVPDDTYMAEILARGHLRVGVDVGTLQLSSVNSVTGEFEGFDVDIAREVAAAVFDRDADDTDDVITFVGVPSSDREEVLFAGSAPTDDGERSRVDLVASAFTITCGRRERIDFSAEYFRAGQRILVRSDNEEVWEVTDLAGRRVCVSAGSTAIDNIRDSIDAGSPEPEIVEAAERLDCLVAIQQRSVDASATDDAILAGMAAQDQNLEIRGRPFSEEPYGLGLPPGRPEWVRYVNAVLEDVAESGRWSELYDEWLAEDLGDDPGPPTPEYRD